MDIIFRPSAAMEASRPSYAQRAALASTPPLADHLLRLMELKQSNICLAAESADGLTTAELLQLAADCGDAIVVLKLHSDAVWDLSPETVRDLTAISKQKGFLLFDDRMFSGASPSVAAQYSATRLHPGAWTSLSSAHIFHGSDVVRTLRNAAVELISNMQSEDHEHEDTLPYSRKWRNDSASYFTTRQSFEEPSTYTAQDLYSPITPTAAPSSSVKNASVSRKSVARHTSTPSRTSLLSRSALADAYQAAGQRPPLQRKGSKTEARQPMSPSSAVVAPFDRRKSSIVSINTTISSSTEYIGSPATANTRGQPSASITMSASSPNISPCQDEDDGKKSQKLRQGPPLSRGILLNTDLDSSIFQQSSIIGAYSADSWSTSFKRACAKVARLDKDFVLGFVSDGQAAAAAAQCGTNGTTGTVSAPADSSYKFLNFVSNCSFADDRLNIIREQRRLSRSARLAIAASQTNGHESSEEEPDDSDADLSDADPQTRRSSRNLLPDLSPAALIRDQHADVLIVGAPIIQAMDKRKAIERYRKAGWEAYLRDIAQEATLAK